MLCQATPNDAIGVDHIGAGTSGGDLVEKVVASTGAKTGAIRDGRPLTNAMQAREMIKNDPTGEVRPLQDAAAAHAHAELPHRRPRPVQAEVQR